MLTIRVTAETKAKYFTLVTRLFIRSRCRFRRRFRRSRCFPRCRTSRNSPVLDLNAY